VHGSAEKITMVVVGGFLGAGKTTMMLKAARLLEAEGKRVGVILNDQGDQLVDTELGHAVGVGVAEVTGGCFCCRFDDLVSTTTSIVEERGLDVVLAEAVGSCADLNATVVRPLREYYGDRFRVAPLTVVVDAARWRDLVPNYVRAEAQPGKHGVSVFNDLAAYLFCKQLEEARAIALNKTDLLSGREVDEFQRSIEQAFPFADIRLVSAHTGEGLDGLVRLWAEQEEDAGPEDDFECTLEIDYNKYADAEAQLAWLNATVQLENSTGGRFSPGDWVELLLARLSSECEERNLVVGHVKAQLTTQDGWTKASLVRAGDAPVFDSLQETSADRGELLVNARVEAEPAVLQGIVEEALESAGESLRADREIVHMQCFSPAAPRPTHRIA
jgi:G3E family GTPase